MQDAAADLLRLRPDGLQLTPGCVPTSAFAAWVEYQQVPVRTHDGFDWRSRRRDVWAPDGSLLTAADSVHPPLAGRAGPGWFDALAASGSAVELMYPGWELGSGAAIDAVLATGLPVAVDVSHLNLQRAAGVLPDGVQRRLFAYPHVVEVHVSHNDGRADRHWPLEADSYGLGWARERAVDDVPVVCESYLHHVAEADRVAMMELVREAVAA